MRPRYVISWRRSVEKAMREWKDWKPATETYDLTGVKVHDAVKLFMPKKIIPTKYVEKRHRIQPVSSESLYTYFENRTNLPAGLNQMLVFAKALKYDYLPKQIVKISQSVDIYADKVAENAEICVRNQVVNRSDQDVLPRKINFEKAHTRDFRNYGVTNNTIIDGLLHLLTFYARTVARNIDPNQRVMTTSHIPSIVSIEKNGKQTFIKTDIDKIWLSREPLPSFADADEVAATANKPLVDIYPIDCLMGWRKTSTMKLEDKHWMADDTRQFQYPHTVFSPFWGYTYVKDENHVSKCLASALGAAVNYARFKYGPDIVIPPKPVTVQGIYMDKCRIGFLVFQLNTLDFNSADGLKNIVWVEPFRRIYTDGYFNEKVEDFDPGFLKLYSAFALSGFNANPLFEAQMNEAPRSSSIIE